MKNTESYLYFQIRSIREYVARGVPTSARHAVRKYTLHSGLWKEVTIELSTGVAEGQNRVFWKVVINSVFEWEWTGCFPHWCADSAAADGCFVFLAAGVAQRYYNIFFQLESKMATEGKRRAAWLIRSNKSRKKSVILQKLLPWKCYLRNVFESILIMFCQIVLRNVELGGINDVYHISLNSSLQILVNFMKENF